MLVVESLRRTFGTVVALDDVSLRVEEGAIFGFVGGNGAGKTTTMRIIMGVLAATSGSVGWRGRPTTRQTRRRFGYIPEERGLYQAMPIEEQIRYFGRLYGLSRSDAAGRAAELVDQLGLGAYRGKKLQTLSLGNQQRVQLAVSMVHRPELLVLDEPFSGLDVAGVESLADLLRQRRDEGTAIIFSSHQLDLVGRLVDSLGIIARGRTVASGSIAEVRRQIGAEPVLKVTRDSAAGEGWPETLPADVLERSEHELVLRPRDAVGPAPILEQLVRHGSRVTSMGWEEPSLADLYRKAIA